MSFRKNLRTLKNQISDIWHDRDVYVPAFFAGLKTVPERFKNADRQQKLSVAIAVIIILASQVAFLVIA